MLVRSHSTLSTLSYQYSIPILYYIVIYNNVNLFARLHVSHLSGAITYSLHEGTINDEEDEDDEEEAADDEVL